jgi:hypothetical protein
MDILLSRGAKLLWRPSLQRGILSSYETRFQPWNRHASHHAASDQTSELKTTRNIGIIAHIDAVSNHP